MAREGMGEVFFFVRRLQGLGGGGWRMEGACYACLEPHAYGALRSCAGIGTKLAHCTTKMCFGAYVQLFTGNSSFIRGYGLL